MQCNLNQLAQPHVLPKGCKAYQGRRLRKPPVWSALDLNRISEKALQLIFLLHSANMVLP